MSDGDYRAGSVGFDELNEIRIAKEVLDKVAAVEAKQDLEKLRQEIRVATLNRIWIENYADHFLVTIEGVAEQTLANDPFLSFRCHRCGISLPSRVEELLREAVEVFQTKNYVRSFRLEILPCVDCGEPNEVTVQMRA